MSERKDTSQFITNLCEEYRKHNFIDPKLYNDPEVKRGLRNANGTGVIAGLSQIGDVVGYKLENGQPVPVPGELYYRGYSLTDLINGFTRENSYGFEEVSYLLVFGHLPTKDDLEFFFEALGALRTLPEHYLQSQIIGAPSPDIMNKMARLTLGLYSFDDNPDDTSLENLMRQGMELIARFPTLLAYSYQAKRYFYDKKSLHLHFPHDNQSTAESILRVVRSNKQFTEEEARLLDLCLVIHAEHGGGNNSAFTCRVVSSTGTDTYAAIASALCSLKGPKHGGANIKVMEMFEDIKANAGNWKDEGAVADYLVKMLRGEAGDGSGLIYGLGHPIYTLSDPRAVILKENARRLAEEKGFGDDFHLAETIERLAPDLMKTVRGIDKNICANVDFYSGLVYKTLDIPVELFTPLFAAARIAGWIAHRIEEVSGNARIIRPAYRVVYDPRPYVDIKDRT
ncbi:MAG: citrate synthase [Oscillospiraceae bacterium]|nr:citrate synthase [Oscillospiraceae bacterium]